MFSFHWVVKDFGSKTLPRCQRKPAIRWLDLAEHTGRQLLQSWCEEDTRKDSLGTPGAHPHHGHQADPSPCQKYVIHQRNSAELPHCSRWSCASRGFWVGVCRGEQVSLRFSKNSLIIDGSGHMLGCNHHTHL